MCRKMKTLQSVTRRHKGTEILFAMEVICPLVQYYQNEPVIARPKVYDREIDVHSRVYWRKRGVNRKFNL